MSRSHKEIAQSTGLIGAVHVIKIVLGIVQNKVLAVMIGSTGFGVWGMYNTFVEMVSSFSTLGIDQSGVKQIAQNPDGGETAKTIWILRRVLWVVSALAALISMSLSRSISRALFQTDNYWWGIVVVSTTIFFNGIWKGNISILNGLRYLKELAASHIVGSVAGALAAIASVAILGVRGIPLFLALVGATLALTTWWWVKKRDVKEVRPTLFEAGRELKKLLSIGLGFSVSAAIAALMSYLSRVYLISEFGLGAVGIYQAGWTISNVYIGTVLTAMGVDFMPRLMKVIRDDGAANKMAAEQIEFGVLASSIGVLGILVFSPLVLNIFYSSEFAVGTSIIRWQVLGVAMRVFGFVFGYIIMAKEKPAIYVVMQAVIFVSDYLFLILFSKLFGFDGLGVNYFVSYSIYLVLIYLVCGRLTGFRFSRNLWIIASVEVLAIGAVWFLPWFLEGPPVVIAGCLFMAVYAVWLHFAAKKYMQMDAVEIIKSKLRGKHGK